MSHGLLEILKYFFLALLWLFFLYAARMVLIDVQRGRRTGASPEADGSSPHRGSLRLRVVEGVNQTDRSYDLDQEVTLGRSPSCDISFVDDTYASSIHARVYPRNGEVFVEDLGSRNGTYVNEEPLDGPTPLERGDRLRVGSTVLEVRR
jgi:hypothetical protein